MDVLRSLCPAALSATVRESVTIDSMRVDRKQEDLRIFGVPSQDLQVPGEIVDVLAAVVHCWLGPARRANGCTCPNGENLGY